MRSDVGKLVELCRRGVTRDEDATAMLRMLRDALGASSAMLMQALDHDVWNRSVDAPEDWLAVHAQLRHLDPSVPSLAGLPPGTWYVGERDLPEATRVTELGASFYRTGLSDFVIAKVYSPFRDDLYLALYRERGAFDASSIAMLDLLYPHLAGALASRRALAAIGRDEPVDARAWLELGFPGGEPTFSRGARALVESRLGTLTAQGWERFAATIRRAAMAFSTAHIGGRSQRLVGELRLELAYGVPRAKETMRFIGVLVDESRRLRALDPAPAEALLSTRERQIARNAASGLAAPAIAALHGITVATVRTHLRSIYRKLDVSSRVELARLLDLS